MLPDWLESLLTSCPRHLRKMGYFRELLNIRRCLAPWGDVWEPHFEHTRAVIRTAIGRCASRRKAVVLGSGWLNDVPIIDLAGAFRQVVLVDAVHPYSVVRRVRRLPNVHLLSADVGGVAEAVYRSGTMLRHTPNLFCDDDEVDLVASVNLLSQLPYWPVQHLTRAGVHAADEITAYARDLVAAHLDYLRRLPGIIALVADMEEMTISNSGQILRRETTIYGAELPWKGESWTWPLVPRQRKFPHHGLFRTVVGIPDLKAAISASCRTA
jgi:hypothetical protein